MPGGTLDALAGMVSEWKEGIIMRLYLFELEKMAGKPQYAAMTAGGLLITAAGWRAYAGQADFHAGEAQAVMLLLTQLHGLLAAMISIIFTASVFSGEYSLKMEELLQAAPNGREKTADSKAAAVTTLFLLLYGLFLGADYLFVRCVWGKEIWKNGRIRPVSQEMNTLLSAGCGQVLVAAVFLGICSALLFAGSVYCLSAFSRVPWQAAAGAGIGYFACRLLFDWGLRAGFPPAALLFSFSPAVLAEFRLFKVPWERKWFGGFYLWLVPAVTTVLCIVFFLMGRRKFLCRKGGFSQKG